MLVSKESSSVVSWFFLNFRFVVYNFFNMDFLVHDVVFAGNEYMFYLAFATLASRMGGIPKPSVVTHSGTADVAARDIPKRRKVT